MTELESKCLYEIIWNCIHISEESDFPMPIYLLSHHTGEIRSRCRKAVRELRKQELVYLTNFRGTDEDDNPFCVWGYKPTEKAKGTEEYKKAVEDTKGWERKDI